MHIRRLRAAALALAALLLAPSARASAQTFNARCTTVVAAACSQLTIDVVADAFAPLSLASLGVQLGGAYAFVGGAAPAFAGLDDFAFGTPFSGTATAPSPTALHVDFLASPGFTFELAPGSAGWLRFDVLGTGAAPVTIAAADPDGGTLGGPRTITVAPTTTTPEPASAALLGAGLLALAGTLRRRARA
ncbi:MAG: PEP-CTERM sorting domain-containing protein [Gemmatirosa sp.]|nr:PEP-CTERM sorting domain-containing protein [Gemmatirosa sp.]